MKKETTKSIISGLGAILDSKVPMLGSALSSIATDVLERHLSSLEVQKIEFVILTARNAVQHRIDAGEVIRQDDFLRERTGLAPDSAQLVEGVFIKAKHEHEQKKQYHLGLFLGGLPFAEINHSEANYYLNIFERLTYHQLVMLDFFQTMSVMVTPKSNWSHTQLTRIRGEHHSFNAQLKELEFLGLLSGYHESLTMNVGASGLGSKLHLSFALNEILETDKKEFQKLIHDMMDVS